MIRFIYSEKASVIPEGFRLLWNVTFNECDYSSVQGFLFIWTKAKVNTSVLSQHELPYACKIPSICLSCFRWMCVCVSPCWMMIIFKKTLATCGHFQWCQIVLICWLQDLMPIILLDHWVFYFSPSFSFRRGSLCGLFLWRRSIRFRNANTGTKPYHDSPSPALGCCYITVDLHVQYL